MTLRSQSLVSHYIEYNQSLWNFNRTENQRTPSHGSPAFSGTRFTLWSII